MKQGIWAMKGLIFLVVIVAIAFGVVLGTLYLWNWLVPTLFSGPLIDFWQAAGLLLLSKIFLWGFSGKCRCHSSANSSGPWKHYWKQKWGNMPPEDRERFKQKMKEKWCAPRESASVPNSGTSNG